MGDIEREVRRAGDEQKGLIASTGINPEQFMRRVEASESVGGPEIPIEAVHIDGISDAAFTQSLLRAEADLAQLSGLAEAIGYLPRAAPLGTDRSRTSGFGPRLDPFSGRYAFHSGVDFAGPIGTPVQATAAGRVLFAGRDGAYGNIVELDHGYGLRTRYAPLLAVAVRKGQFLPKGGVVGRLGSTGRSTGPHVHYEIWYDNIVRNPDAFIRLAKLKGVTPAHE
jgi:murein DD-endopeptidase MepM/ murein hydrolase activator NlpD